VEIPDELLETHQDVTISMDGLRVISLKFLSTIAHNIYYSTAQYISQPIASVYKKFLNEVFGTYKCSGIEITEVNCDNEFHQVMDNFIPSNKTLQLTWIDKAHVLLAGRNNLTIQECVRASYHRLPYTHLKQMLVEYLVTEAAKKLNFLQSNMVSPNTSACGWFSIKKT